MLHGNLDGSNREQLMQEYSIALLEAFAEVFNVTLQLVDSEYAFPSADHGTAANAQQSVNQTLRTG